MPKLSGIKHLRAIKAFEKAGFKIIRQGKHITKPRSSWKLEFFCWMI